MGKRSNGDGNIRKQKNGTWRAELMDGYTDEGKRNVVRFSGKTRAEVKEKLRAYQQQVEANIHLDKDLSFGEFADLWYADYRSQVQPSTYSGYKYTLALLKKHFGAMPLYEILPLHINRFLIGSCKFKNEAIGTDELELLRNYASRFTTANDVCCYYVFSKSGFTSSLLEKQEQGEVTLVSIEQVYQDIF